MTRIAHANLLQQSNVIINHCCFSSRMADDSKLGLRKWSISNRYKRLIKTTDDVYCATLRDLPEKIMYCLITARQQSRGKVKFSVVSVCVFTGVVGVLEGSHVTIIYDALNLTNQAPAPSCW